MIHALELVFDLSAAEALHALSIVAERDKIEEFPGDWKLEFWSFL